MTVATLSSLAVGKLPELVQRIMQDPLRRLPVRDGMLEILVILIPVRARRLHVLLHVGDLKDHTLLLVGELFLVSVEPRITARTC